ncbi:hypothetical protein RDWZM_003892 [Blomia tropicalis]|uniref:Transmembrane protein 65 n=1 Tax=Blomia tropicalis TaxID=40697 RepID=A0A9Q0MJ39_BLOTA|nr:hypothetical protein RDWZM_003892 [Blomia tropicalis]
MIRRVSPLVVKWNRLEPRFWSIRRIAYNGKIDVTQEVKIKELIAHMKCEERQLLYSKLREVLLEQERLKQSQTIKPRNKLMAWFARNSANIKRYIEKPTNMQLISLFIFHSLPYVTFGCLDNFIMIMAGDYIEKTIGKSLGISMMASAGIGNTLANSTSIAVAYHVEKQFNKRVSRASSMSIGQFEMRRTKVVVQSARIIGIVVGCLIGMLPLLLRE